MGLRIFPQPLYFLHPEFKVVCPRSKGWINKRYFLIILLPENKKADTTTYTSLANFGTYF